MQIRSMRRAYIEDGHAVLLDAFTPDEEKTAIDMAQGDWTIHKPEIIPGPPYNAVIDVSLSSIEGLIEGTYAAQVLIGGDEEIRDLGAKYSESLFRGTTAVSSDP